MKPFFIATLTLVGTIIGVGIFGVPYAFSKAGVMVGVGYLILLATAMVFVNLLYGEIILNTKERHRLVGFAGIYLGSAGKRLALISNVLGFYGAIIAYVIVGGQFLYIFLHQFFGGDIFLYQIIFWLIIAVAIAGGLRFVSFAESWLTFLLLLTLIVIIAFLTPHFRLDFLLERGEARNIFLPYGVMLFSLSGMSAIPEMRDILGRKSKFLKYAVTTGVAIAAVFTLIFSLAVVAVTGPATSQEAITGLQALVGSRIVQLGALFGILAVATSFLVIGLNLKELFSYDYKFSSILAWALAVCVPFAAFLLGAQNFIGVIGFTGAVFGGLDGILTALIARAARVQKRAAGIKLVPAFRLVVPILITIFSAGIVAEAIFFISR